MRTVKHVRKVTRLGVIVAAVALLTACELRVSPASTDPRIDRALDDHLVVFDEHRPPGNRLFVMLPGSGGRPAGYANLLRQVAAKGMPAIGLMYPNERSVASICGDAGRAPDCFEEVREEIVYGVDRSPLVSVDPANSIVSRLAKLLEHLHWDQYLSGGQPRWDRIVIAGHSQGGGHAGIIGRDHAVARVVFFASPADFTTSGGAPWLLEPKRTPIDRWYGFAHTADTPFARANWAAMEMLGTPTPVEGATPPYGGAHQLTTGADVSDPHSAVATRLRYAPVWAYLCCSTG
jgi:hypothetical protein